MASAKQVAANRENAKKSPGPRSPAGKARSSLNALKHGAYCASCLTPDEQDADFRRLKRMYVAYYAPETELDVRRVLKLAAQDWRLERCARMEAEILAAHGYEPTNQEEKFEYAGAGWGFSHDCKKAKSLSILSQVENRAHRRFKADEKELEKSLARRRAVEEAGVEKAVGLAPTGTSPEPENTQK